MNAAAESFDSRFAIIGCGVALLAVQAVLWLGLVEGAHAVMATAVLAAALLAFALRAYLRERRACAEARQRVQELEQAGAVLAHELNNALHAVRGSVEILSRCAGDHPDVMKFSDMARRNAERCALIMQSFSERLDRAEELDERLVQKHREAASGAAAAAPILHLDASRHPEVGPQA
jgi:signal transduction histidine kinase